LTVVSVLVELIIGQFDWDLDMDFGCGWTSFVRGEVQFGEFLLAGSFFAGAQAVVGDADPFEPPSGPMACDA
jgi:hypothetical protein